jgi:molecular chaperone GrpE
MSRRKEQPDAAQNVAGNAPDQGPEPAEADATSSPEAEAMLADLKAELDEAIQARKRALADFANYQKRALDNEHRAGRSATVAVIRSLLPVLDHFDLALGQDPASVTVPQLLGGVRMVRTELDTALARHGISRIEPRVGDEFDPMRHEAVMRRAVQDVPPGHVATVLQAGYAMDEVVLRPARVVVAAAAEGH